MEKLLLFYLSLVMCFTCDLILVQCIELHVDHSQTDHLHASMTQFERMILLGHQNQKSPYDVFTVNTNETAHVLHSLTRCKRQLSSPSSSSSSSSAPSSSSSWTPSWKSNLSIKKYPQEINLTFTALGETFKLHLERSKHLFTNQLTIREEANEIDQQQQHHLNPPAINCFYQGHLISHVNTSAAISLCNGIRGFIQTDSATFIINPLPSRLIKHVTDRWTEPIDPETLHIITRKDSHEPLHCPYRREGRPHSPFISNSFRNKRSLTTNSSHEASPVTVETAVFVDETLYDLMKVTFGDRDPEEEIITYVLTIMNAVQLLFKQPSLGRQVIISVVLMDILKAQPKDLQPSDNIDTYLTNFCVWQHNKRLNLASSSPRWDHALLLSGINMYVVDTNGRKKRHVVGLAPVSGMCNSLNSCTISEGTNFQTVLVASHEMGHSLGMEHDGPQDGNSCNSDDFVMSPTLGAGKTAWSSCSREYLNRFLQTPQANCVLNAASSTNILQSFHSTNLLPGQMFDADRQCFLRFGSTSRKSQLQPLQDICRLLRCDTGPKRNTVVYHAHPALEGTTCGNKMMCIQGNCVSEMRPPVASIDTSIDENSLAESENTIEVTGKAIDGQYGPWSPWSPCTSECLVGSSFSVVGLKVSTRKCNSPSPSNGGKLCQGSNKRIRLCDASKICASMPAYRRLITAEEYISDVCLIASSRDSNLEAKGTQYPSYDRSHSCYVWCHKRGGGYMTQGWQMPDGTACGNHNQIDSHFKSHFCVNGECRSFDCDGISEDESSHCSAASIVSVRKKDKIDFTWSPMSSCFHSCFNQSSGIRLVSKDCSTDNCPDPREWFQLCSSRDSDCPPDRPIKPSEYANVVCQKYRSKYPNLLSGKGKQLTPRNGSEDSACVVACQDRIWKDIHYQMDAFTEGKFPLGTSCGSQANDSAYCVDGRCVRFDTNGFPVVASFDEFNFVRNQLKHISHFRNRHRRSLLS